MAAKASRDGGKPSRSEEPFPWRVYRNPDPLDRLFSARLGWWDSWRMAYVVLGRARSGKGRVSKAWSPAAMLTRSGEVYCPDGIRPGLFLESVAAEMKSEADAYEKRSREWLAAGGTLRDLDRAMAIENGTLPKADTPIGGEE